MSFKIRGQFLLVPLFFFLFNAYCIAQDLYSSGMSSPLTVKIKMNKDVFKVGEDVEGNIKLRNTYANGIPAIFVITLFHEGKKISSIETFIKHVPLGETDFSFKTFGIPIFNDTSDSEGDWSIIVLQKDLDESYAQKSNVHIVPRTKM